MRTDEFKRRIDELGHFLEPYLSNLGIVADGSGKINCINPSHKDDRASMRLMLPERNGLYCYACGAHYSIFDVAHILENKPVRGTGFITDNVNYLSQKFGLEEVKVELSAEDFHELACERVHRHAAALFRQMADYKNAESRGWKDTAILKELGVGTVVDKDEFVRKLCAVTGLSTNELADNGIDIRMFGDKRLTFILADDRGECIGFAARVMDFEAQVKAGVVATQKYLNPSHERNILYRKNKFVYNLHRAKDRKFAPVAILTEGYADVVACEMHKIIGAVAVGGVACTADHIHAMLKAGIKDVVIAMDYDFADNKIRAGQDGTLKAIELLRQFPQIRTRVLDWGKIHADLHPQFPDEKKFDIDFILEKKGTEYFNKCLAEAVNTIKFKITELKARGLDNRTIAEELLPDIATAYDELLIQEQIALLAEATEYDKDLLLDKVKKERVLRNQATLAKLDELRTITEKTLSRAGDLATKIDALNQLANEAARLDPRKALVSVERDMQLIELIEREADGVVFNPTARCGLEDIDFDLGGGLPLNGKLLVFGGRPHVGKTQLQQRMLTNSLNANPNVDYMVWTLDDDARSWVQRIWSALSGLPIHICQRPSEFLRNDSRGMSLYKGAREKVKNWIQDRRLIIRDGSGGNHVAVLEGMVASHVKTSNRPLILFFDNFHKTSGSSDRKNLEETAQRIKDITQQYGVTVIANAELRKSGGEADAASRMPPTEDDLKETGKLHYDADYLVLVDCPMTRLPYNPDLKNPKTGEPYRSYKNIENSCWQPQDSNLDMPTLHLLRKKNKIWNSDGQPNKTFYLDFDSRRVLFYKRVPTARPNIYD